MLSVHTPDLSVCSAICGRQLQSAIGFQIKTFFAAPLNAALHVTSAVYANSVQYIAHRQHVLPAVANQTD